MVRCTIAPMRPVERPAAGTVPRPAHEARQRARRQRMALGLKVRKYRETAGWIRHDLALQASDLYEVDDEAVRRIEAGHQTDLAILAPVLRAVGISLADLLEIMGVEPW